MNRRASAAYTLIEMMVCAGIVSLLYVLTSGAIHLSRQRGREAQCAVNMRQLFVAFQLYRTQNDGGVPLSSLTVQPSGRAISTLARSHNRLGYYTRDDGLVPQGLGRVYLHGSIPQPGLLYCPGDLLLSEESPVTGLQDLGDRWSLRYPLLTSYILRPIGRTVPEEEIAALAFPLELNAGAKALITEVSGNHPEVLLVARVSGAVERVRGVSVYGRPLTAIGVEEPSGNTVFQGAYEVDIGLSGLFWLALDGAHADGDDGDDGDDDHGKVTICHIPPGNPEDAHTIQVSPSAVGGHLAHGDHLGPCDGTEGDDDDDDYPYPVDKHGRVVVCHRPDKSGGRRVTLRLPPDAVPAHLAHGDSLGVCEEPED